MESIPIMKHDALRPAVPSVQLALEHANSDDYFQQMLSIDPALQALEMSMKTLKLNRQAAAKQDVLAEYIAAEESRIELTRLVWRFEKLQTAARKGFNSRARSLRKAKVGILDLPNELLSIIFDHLKRPLDDPDFSFGLLHVDGDDADAMAIQNVRLTCRRFNENGSYLLVRHLDIAPTRSSLKHLEELTRRPEIWRGERVLRIDLRYYSAAIAADLQAFSVMCYNNLQNKITFEQPEDGSYDEDPSLNQVEQPLRISLSWRPFRDGKPIKKGARLDAAALALRRGYKRYRELFQQQQQILRDGHFARIVAEAAASSHSEVWLSKSDTGRHCGYEGPLLVERVKYSDLEKFADPEFLVQSCMIKPHPWWHAKGDRAGQIPQSLLYELPLAMRAAEARFAGLAVRIYRPYKLNLNMPQDQLSGLGEVTKGLEAFTFRMYQDFSLAPRPSLEKMNGLYAYLRAAMGPQSVPNLSLDLPPMGFIDDQVAHGVVERLSIKPLLRSPSWHKLRFARLVRLEMDLQDLSTLMGMLESKVRFELRRIYLSSGTWAAALDCLRSKAAWGSE